MKVVFRCDPALLDCLARPELARHTLPEWLRTMPRTAFSDTHGQDVRTVKQCPPFVDAMSHGFVIPLPCDVHASDGVLSWDWEYPALSVGSHPRSPLSFHVSAQAAGTPFFSPDMAIVKFNSFWTIELEAGYSLFATHPINRVDLPFRTLTGLVDSDRFTDVGVLFPAQWVDPEFEGVLPKGTPVAQCFPVERARLDPVFEAFTDQDARRYESMAEKLLSQPNVYRKNYRVRRAHSPAK